MAKLWRIAWNEFKRNVFSKGFILALLSLPLLICIVFGMGILFEGREESTAPLGYVDESGILSHPTQPPLEEPIDMISFESEEAARKALDDDQIQAYYLIPLDYRIRRQVELFYLNEPGENATAQFNDFMRINLLSDQPAQIAYRAAVGTHMILRTPDGKRAIPEGGPPLEVVIPLMISMAFIGLTLFSSGYLMDAMVQERSNYVIEILTTSVSSIQMVAGKIVGIIAINLLQLTAWVLFGALVVFLGKDVLDLTWFQSPKLDWGAILVVIAIALPSYFMASTLMFAIGSNVTDAQEGQWVGMVFYLLFFSPAMLIVVMVENAGVATLLTVLPFTSLLSVSVRNMFMQIPAWQILLSIAVQGLCALMAVWVAVRAFRLGMLRYGQKVQLKEIFSKARAKSAIREMR